MDATTLPDPEDPTTDAVVARHARTLPGWAARWDAAILARRDRLARRAPRTYRVLLAAMLAGYLVTDALMPRRRVRPAAIAMVAATLFDSLATYVWVTRAVAIEANPLVGGVMAAFGDGPGLALRAALSITLVVLLARLARRHWEARTGMLLAALALGAVTAVHTYGVALLA